MVSSFPLVSISCSSARAVLLVTKSGATLIPSPLTHSRSTLILHLLLPKNRSKDTGVWGKLIGVLKKTGGKDIALSATGSILFCFELRIKFSLLCSSYMSNWLDLFNWDSMYHPGAWGRKWGSGGKTGVRRTPDCRRSPTVAHGHGEAISFLSGSVSIPTNWVSCYFFGFHFSFLCASTV